VSELGRTPFESDVCMPENRENLHQHVAKVLGEELARMWVEVCDSLNGCQVWR
jgi:hypothetical protein